MRPEGGYVNPNCAELTLTHEGSMSMVLRIN